MTEGCEAMIGMMSGLTEDKMKITPENVEE